MDKKLCILIFVFIIILVIYIIIKSFNKFEYYNINLFHQSTPISKSVTNKKQKLYEINGCKVAKCGNDAYCGINSYCIFHIDNLTERDKIYYLIPIYKGTYCINPTSYHKIPISIRDLFEEKSVSINDISKNDLIEEN